MNWLRDRILSLSDAPTERLKDELREWAWSDEGLWMVSRHLIGNLRLNERVHRPALMWGQKQISTSDNVFAYRDNRAMGKTDGFSVAVPFWAFAHPPVPGTPIQGTDTCIAYVMPKKDLASFILLASINDRFNKCPLYFELFPWVRKSRFWSLKHGFKLERESVVGMPNILPLGMESISTSLHPPILIVDDPIHEQNYKSRVLVAQVKDWVRHSHALVAPVHGVRAFIGNRWAIDDLQSELAPDSPDCKREFKRVQVWERGITGCETCVAGETATFPEGGSVSGRIPGHIHEGPTLAVALAKADGEVLGEDGPPEGPEYIIEVRDKTDTLTFLTQHENNLIDPGLLKFRKENLKFWEWFYHDRGDMAIKVNVAPTVADVGIKQGLADRYGRDPHLGTFELLRFDELDFYILVDPAPTEEAREDRCQFAAAVYALERAGPREFLIEEYANNAPEHKHIDLLLDWYDKYRPWFRKFGIESVGYQKTLKDGIMVAARGRGVVTLREQDFEMLSRLRSEGQQEDRINYTLSPKLEARLLYVHPSHRIFITQHDRFGVKGAKHDLLDAISNIDRVASKRRGGSRVGALEVAEAARRRLGSTGATGHE